MLINQFIQFKKLVLLSIILIYLLILAGGIVRSTGSGMGCPDWPKCFGQWVPPINIAELPTNYKEKFQVGTHHIADFNVFKTWVEYTNRLLGVLVGFAVLLMCVYSLRFIGSKNTSFFVYSLSILILTCLQGWIGAKVVATNLSKYMISIHMLIAIVILSLCLFLFHKVSVVNVSQTEKTTGFDKVMILLFILTFIQILVGTQVRQEIDTIAIRYQEANRQLWINELGTIFSLHRVVALSVVLLNSVVAYFFIKKNGYRPIVSRVILSAVFFLFLEYAFGVSMVWYAIPFLTQPFHLFFATLVFGLQFYAWLSVKYSQNWIVADNLNLLPLTK